MTADYNRQPNGKFGAGNDGGPGRPKREVEAHSIGIFCEEISDDDLKAIARSHVSFAKAGNVQSARLIFDYKLGKPAEHIEVMAEQATRYVLEMPRVLEDGSEQEFYSDNHYDRNKPLGSGQPNNGVSDDCQEPKSDINQE